MILTNADFYQNGLPSGECELISFKLDINLVIAELCIVMSVSTGIAFT